MVHFIIPARKGSKGLRHKNRRLVSLMEDRFPKKVKDRMILTTDDPWLHQKFKKSLFRVHKRDKKLAQDDTSIKPVIERVAKKYRFYPNDDVCLLYPTYPQRTYDDIREVLMDYQKNRCSSMLCCNEWGSNTWGYTMIDRDKDTRKATMVFPEEEGVYRRQDSTTGRVGAVQSFEEKPTYYEYSHFVCIFKLRLLPQLNRNLYNLDKTVFYRLDEKKIDVDSEQDWMNYKKWEEKNGND